MYTRRCLVKILGLPSFVLVLIVVLASSLGCSPPADPPEKQTATVLDIECQAFYRPSVGQAPGDGTVISLGGQGDSGTAEYIDMVFDVQLSDDPGEVVALIISVTAKEGGDQIVRSLYQIDQAKGLHDQFIGGHGFTGLVYVYHPASAAELQYFCGVDSQ